MLLEMNDQRHGRIVVEDGQRVVLLGASGAGKTRLLRAVLGLGAPELSVQICGQRLNRKHLATSVGWVPERGGDFADLTVLENVESPPHVAPLPRERAVDALDLLGLGERLGERASMLSINERRRLCLARVVARRVPLLVIDGDLDATLAPLLPALLNVTPHIRGVVTSGCTADDWAWRADGVVLIQDARAVCQAPLAMLVDRPEAAIRSVLTWVLPGTR
jgi:ABC-type branched-subunit amino acid transport system ATPase component